MSEQLRRRPAQPGVLLQAAADEALELRRSRGRGSGWFPIAYQVHERRPVGLDPGLQERQPPDIAFQEGKPEAPHIPGVPVVAPVVLTGVNSFGAHVGVGSDAGIAGIQRPR